MSQIISQFEDFLRSHPNGVMLVNYKSYIGGNLYDFNYVDTELFFKMLHTFDLNGNPTVSFPFDMVDYELTYRFDSAFNTLEVTGARLVPTFFDVEDLVNAVFFDRRYGEEWLRISLEKKRFSLYSRRFGNLCNAPSYMLLRSALVGMRSFYVDKVLANVRSMSSVDAHLRIPDCQHAIPCDMNVPQPSPDDVEPFVLGHLDRLFTNALQTFLHKQNCMENAG